MIYIFFAEGFEEAEALVPADVLRRAGFEVKTVGVTGKYVTGTHGIRLECDITADEVDKGGLEGVILPGGMPGTLNLAKSETVSEYLRLALEGGLVIGAICAAPSVLGRLGMLKGRRATCFDGFEEELIGAELTDAPAVRDVNIVTGRGAGSAFEFAFCLLDALGVERESIRQLARDMKYPYYAEL